MRSSMPESVPTQDRSEFYFQSLVSILERDLGRGMALTTVKQYCDELGIKETAIEEQHIEVMATRLRDGLAAFVGRRRLDALIKQILKIREYDDWGIL
jgi:hypothetical protein